MTGQYNVGWSSLNSQRPWPFEDNATLMSDDGVRMPLDLFSQIRVWFPSSAGDIAYVGAVSSTPRVKTVIVMASENLGLQGIPIAAVTVSEDFEPHHPYAVSPMYPGVGGWVSFGSFSGELYRGTFALPSQSFIAKHNAKHYVTPSVSSVGKHREAGLQGLVELYGGNDVEIKAECLKIDDHIVYPGQLNYCGGGKQTVIRIGLRSKLGETSQADLLKQYSGECVARVENRTCREPEPVERIGNVEPDCCGTITIAIRGCGELQALRQVVVSGTSDDGITFSDLSYGALIYCPVRAIDMCNRQYQGEPPDTPTSLCD